MLLWAKVHYLQKLSLAFKSRSTKDLAFVLAFVFQMISLSICM